MLAKSWKFQSTSLKLKVLATVGSVCVQEPPAGGDRPRGARTLLVLQPAGGVVPETGPASQDRHGETRQSMVGRRGRGLRGWMFSCWPLTSVSNCSSPCRWIWSGSSWSSRSGRSALWWKNASEPTMRWFTGRRWDCRLLPLVVFELFNKLLNIQEE